MFKRRDSSGATGNGGGSRKSGGLFAGVRRLFHRSSTGSQRRSRHVTYEIGFFQGIWSTVTGRPPRRPGTTRGKKRKLSSLKWNTSPVRHHQGRKKNLPKGMPFVGFEKATHQGRRRGLKSGYLGSGPPPPRHGGRKRKLRGSLLGAVVPHQPHQGRKRKKFKVVSQDLLVHQPHHGRKRRSNGKNVRVAFAQHRHQGKKRSYSSRTWAGMPQSVHRGKKFKVGGLAGETLLPSVVVPTHGGARRNKHKSKGFFGLPHVAHRGDKYNKHKRSKVFHSLHVPHVGAKKNHHNRVSFGGAVPYSHSGHKGGQMTSGFSWGAVPYSHSGQKSGQKRGTYLWGASPTRHGGSRRKIQSGRGFLTVPTVRHSGNKSNHHKRFTPAYQAQAYRSGGMRTLVKPKVYQTLGKGQAYAGTSGKYKVKAKGKRNGMVVPSYHAGSGKHKYKPKKGFVLKSDGKYKNATAKRRADMAYLKKNTKGKKRKNNETGMYQGHGTFNEFLRRVILVLSILVAITLFILASTVDRWWGKEQESSFIETPVAVFWEKCQKKTLYFHKEL